MTWILSVCAAAWLLCGSYVEAQYPSEEACYKALNDLYKRNPTGYKYVICSPITGVKKPS